MTKCMCCGQQLEYQCPAYDAYCKHCDWVKRSLGVGPMECEFSYKQLCAFVALLVDEVNVLREQVQVLEGLK